MDAQRRYHCLEFFSATNQVAGVPGTPRANVSYLEPLLFRNAWIDVSPEDFPSQPAWGVSAVWGWTWQGGQTPRGEAGSGAGLPGLMSDPWLGV